MRRAAPFAPLLAASMTVLISASIIAENAAAVRAAGPRLLAAVVCLHLGDASFMLRALLGNGQCMGVPVPAHD